MNKLLTKAISLLKIESVQDLFDYFGQNVSTGNQEGS
jgi:hypothetical protein